MSGIKTSAKAIHRTTESLLTECHVVRADEGIRQKRTNTLYQGYLHHIANFCATVLSVFSKEIISN